MHTIYRLRNNPASALLVLGLWLVFMGIMTYSILELIPVANAQTLDLALNKSISASSSQSPSFTPNFAVDGNLQTRWSSAYNDNQFLLLDLGNPYNLTNLHIDWEAAVATDFDVQTSENNLDWVTIASIRGNKSLTSDIAGGTAQARYVKLVLIKRATPYGFSILNLQAYGQIPVTLPPVVFKFEPPVCYAKDDEERRQYTALPPRLIVAWFCDRPGGIQGYVRVFTFQSLLSSVAINVAYGTSLVQKAQLDAYMTTHSLTPDEQAAADTFLAKVRPTAQVAQTASNKRPIYTANPDRTVGLATGSKIASGQPCLINDRLVTLDTDTGLAQGTNYYAVSGGYAVCTITGAVTK